MTTGSGLSGMFLHRVRSVKAHGYLLLSSIVLYKLLEFSTLDDRTLPPPLPIERHCRRNSIGETLGRCQGSNKRMKKPLCLFFLLLPLLSATTYAQPRGLGLAPSPAERRIALVVGNSAYATAPLKNPVHDARDMAQTLRDLGFDVLYKENINQNEMKRAIRAF